MSKKKIYYDWQVPFSVVKIVNALCADYERREKLIKSENISDECRRNVSRINAAIDSALEDIELGIRKELLLDITYGRGFLRSACCVFMNKDSYYRRRRKFVYDIAVNLNLIDSLRLQQ